MAKITRYGMYIKDNYPDKYKKLVDAMNRSKGKVNNVLGLALAMSDTTTVEDVVRMASGYGTKSEDMEKYQNILGYAHDNQPWDVVSGRTKQDILNTRKTLREERFQKKFRYNFEDTVLYRTMVKFGLSSKLEKEKTYWGRTTYSTNGKYGSKISDSNYAQPVFMFYHAGEELRNAIVADENLNEMWTEQAQIQRSIHRPYSEKEKELHPMTSTDEEWRKFQTEYIVKEFNQLAHMDENLKRKMNDWVKQAKEGKGHRSWGYEKLPPIVMHSILEGFKYPAEDKTIELIREAFEVMDYIGIGVCWNYVKTETIESNPDGSIKYDDEGKEIPKIVYRDAYVKEIPYKVGAMLKHVSSTMRRFAADIKKGFDVQDVRELVVEDLNGWVEAQARGHWQFFVRDDAPKEYPDLQKKKKQNKKENLELTDLEWSIVNKFEAENNNNKKV